MDIQNKIKEQCVRDGRSVPAEFDRTITAGVAYRVRKENSLVSLPYQEVEAARAMGQNEMEWLTFWENILLFQQRKEFKPATISTLMRWLSAPHATTVPTKAG